MNIQYIAPRVTLGAHCGRPGVLVRTLAHSIVIGAQWRYSLATMVHPAYDGLMAVRDFYSLFTPAAPVFTNFLDPSG